MASYNAARVNDPVHSGTWGNVSVAISSITGNGAGAVLAIADVVRFMKLPAGAELFDAQLLTSANEAASTVDLGYTDVLGDAGNTDADYFLAAESIATAGRFRANRNVVPYKLTADAYITLTVGGAQIELATVLTAIVAYRYIG